MPKNYTLIVVHRTGPEYEADFATICARVQALDPEIAAYATDTISKGWDSLSLVTSG